MIFLPKIKTFNHTSTLAHEIDYTMMIIRFFMYFAQFYRICTYIHILYIYGDRKVTQILHVLRSIQCQINIRIPSVCDLDHITRKKDFLRKFKLLYCCHITLEGLHKACHLKSCISCSKLYCVSNAPKGLLNNVKHPL